MKVLVAEDDLTSRMMLQAVIAKWGFEVVAVDDGNGAWETMSGPAAPRMALIDWMMPGIDGVTLCRRIREYERAEPPYLVLLTSRGDKCDTVEGLRAGADDYIVKPYHSAELCARLETGKRILNLQAALAGRIEELQEALVHVRTLQGILPICMHCHRIRNDQESWERIEKYITEHSEAQFSHSICPKCLVEHYPEYRLPKGNEQDYGPIR